MKDNPIQRFPEGRPLADDLGLWAVAHLKSRQDKAFVRDLVTEGIPYYLPLLEKKTRRRDNKKIRKSTIPLFPGYIAFAAGPEKWEAIYSTHRVANLLEVTEQEVFVRELEQIEQVLTGDNHLELLPTFVEGQPVRVKCGPMEGMEGMIIQNRGQMRFVIQVQMFKQSVCVEIEEDYLEAR